MTQKDGGPAFAALATSPMGDVHHQPGMSLRDWFAGQAMAAMYSRSPDEAPFKMSDLTAKAYAAADAMLAERAKESKP